MSPRWHSALKLIAFLFIFVTMAGKNINNRSVGERRMAKKDSGGRSLGDDIDVDAILKQPPTEADIPIAEQILNEDEEWEHEMERQRSLKEEELAAEDASIEREVAAAKAKLTPEQHQELEEMEAFSRWEMENEIRNWKKSEEERRNKGKSPESDRSP